MSGYTEGWALSNEEVSSPAEKLVLYGVAQTVGTDQFQAEIRLEELADFARLTESELRAALNGLAAKRLILNVRPQEGQPSDQPRVFECEVGTPQNWHWQF